MPQRNPSTLVALVAAVLVALTAGTPAGAASCSYPSAYPGDAAGKAAVAGWMAGHAIDAGIPGELPVMASLVDAGLVNRPPGDTDSAGYFQMRLSVWNQGDYAGFPDHPSLQLQWFIDQAIKVRQQRISQGIAQYGADPSTWGEWVADVQRPASQYRGRYQLRLDEARSLIADGCRPSDEGGGGTPGSPGGQPTDTGGGAVPDAQLIPESVLPVLRVRAAARQNPLRAGRLVVSAVCANENCFARARGSMAVPRRGIFILDGGLIKLKRGQRETFSLPVGRRLRRALSAAARAKAVPLAAVRVVAANSGGYRISESRTIAISLAARARSRA